MARRSDHSRAELKEMAVEAGHRLICANGFRNFSARKVASEIGYTIGTIYNIFGSHDLFILHINAKTLDMWYESLVQLASKQVKPLGVHDIAKFYIEYSRSHYNEWSALFEHTLPKEEALPDWYTPKMTRFFDLSESILLPYVANNRRKARRAARVLWASIHGICTLGLTRKLDMVESESTVVLTKSLIDNYLYGLQNGS